MGNPINHGTKNDLNIIVDLTYDKAGRRTSLRDPRGNLTEYDYDLLNRRVELTNPLSKTWTTAYTDLGGGGSRTTLTDPNGINTQRDFDRAGRVQSIQFGNPSNTPDVQFAYDEAGNRARMSEFSGSGFTSKVRETTFTYDDLRRVTAVDFDTDGSGSVDESVSYEYDAAGLKTKMTLPGSLEITYDYDANGRLIGMTDWDAQASQFGYDLNGRHIVTQQDNGLRSRYSYDADGRLITLRHTAGERTLGHFAYHYDKRGNRIRAFEALPHPATTSDTTIAYNDDAVEYRGTWTNSAPYKQTTVFGASLKLAFFGTDATLTVGTGVNHTRFDIYINRQLWKTVDGYAASNGTLAIPIALENEGPHLLEIRNRPQHSQAAKQDGNYDPAVYKLQFKQVLVPDMAYDLHTIEYIYDALSRVEDVAYYAGRNLTASAFRSHAYTYDRLGNRLSASLNGGGATNYTYNAANQLTSDGTNSYTYDNNGNLTNDGVNTHTWDRANRLKSVGNHSYVYDGLGNRVKKTVSGTATSYLLDLHCSMTKVLAQTTGANTDRVLHGPRGVQAFEDNSGDWSFMLPDALGSVRSQVDDTLAIAGMRNFEPYGDPFGEQGSFAGDYGFTGEQTDANELLFLRARYYNPNMATFMTMDAMEGSWDEPLTLNGYGYVGGNPINRTDPTGMFWGNAATLMKPDGGSASKSTVTAKITNKTITQKIQKDVFSTVKPNVVASGPKVISQIVQAQPIVKLPQLVAATTIAKIGKQPSLSSNQKNIFNSNSSQVCPLTELSCHLLYNPPSFTPHGNAITNVGSGAHENLLLGATQTLTLWGNTVSLSTQAPSTGAGGDFFSRFANGAARVASFAWRYSPIAIGVVILLQTRGSVPTDIYNTSDDDVGRTIGPTGRAVFMGSQTISTPQTPNVNFSRGPSGHRITWVSAYNAGRNAITGLCFACTFTLLLDPHFCNVNVVPGHGCAHHVHVYRFYQDSNCLCRVQPDRPDVRCLASNYAGPSGGPHYPFTSPSTIAANPELAICTGGWNQT